MTDNQSTTLPVETGLVVADADRSARFYESVLDFVEVRRVELGDFTRDVGLGEPGRLVWTRSPGGQVLKFYDGGRGSAYSPPSRTPEHSGRHHFVTLYVAELDAVLERAESAGAVRDTSVKTLATGVRVVFLRDLDGHILEIIQRPVVTA